MRKDFLQRKDTQPWPAFLQAQKSMVKAIDMADELIEAGDLAPSEG